MFYVFHGTEEFLRAEEIARFKGEILKDGMGDLNLIVLDGRRVGIRELMDHCSALPFLTPRRLVIVEDLLQRLERRRSGGDDEAEDAPPPDRETRAPRGLPCPPCPRRPGWSLRRASGSAAQPGAAPRGGIPLRARQEFERSPAVPCPGSASAQDKGGIEPGAAESGRSSRGDLRRGSMASWRNWRPWRALARAITVEDVQALVAADFQGGPFGLMDTIGEAGAGGLTAPAAGAGSRVHPYLPTMVARRCG